MSLFSGYDSEAVGFDSISSNAKTETDSSSQTTGYTSNPIGTQALTSQSFGTQTNTDNLTDESEGQPTLDYTSLNAFLRRVIPTMMEALDISAEHEFLHSSESDNEDAAVHAELFQILECLNSLNDSTRSTGGGDSEEQKAPSVLSLSWSSAGNTLAVSLGQSHHEAWCEHDGLIKIYTVKRSAGDKLNHFYDITHSNCVTVLQYHPSIAALLAYATSAGEVVVRNLRNANDEGLGDGAFLTSPSGTHGSRRVSAIQWADAKLALNLLMLQNTRAVKRRGASDQVLVSAGTDGTVNAWQVNPNLDIFSKIICFQLGVTSPRQQTPDIICLDFVRCTEGKLDDTVPHDVFVVGCKSGQLILCNIRSRNSAVSADISDPTVGIMEPHHGCVLDIAFCNQRPGTFASISTDSELRVYNVEHSSPLRVFCIDDALSCLSWFPNNPCLMVLGLGKVDYKGQALAVYNIVSGKRQSVEGLILSEEQHVGVKNDSTTAIAINSSSTNRIAIGNKDGKVTVWDIPVPRMKMIDEEI